VALPSWNARLTRGLACVVTPVGGIPEVITDAENGLLVPVRDSAALAAGLRPVLEDHELALALGERARQTVESRYAIDVVTGVLDGIYKRLIEPPSRKMRS